MDDGCRSDKFGNIGKVNPLFVLFYAGYSSKTFPVLETRAMNGGALLATSRLMRGSALTNAAAISIPWS
jgi:hypothetical protein